MSSYTKVVFENNDTIYHVERLFLKNNTSGMIQSFMNLQPYM